MVGISVAGAILPFRQVMLNKECYWNTVYCHYIHLDEDAKINLFEQGIAKANIPTIWTTFHKINFYEKEFKVMQPFYSLFAHFQSQSTLSPPGQLLQE